MTYLVGSIFVTILGALLGSFAGVISERLGTGQSWVSGRSHCNSCNETLTVLDLVPVLSWFVHQGRCRTCRASVPYLYTLTEVILGTLFFAGFTYLGVSPALIVLYVFLFIATIIVLYDLRHTIVPFKLSLLLIACGAALAALLSSDLHTLGTTFIGAGAIALGFFLMHVLSSGRWMGLGDTPIALAFSFVAGRFMISGLLFSFWIGAAIGIIILVLTPRGHRMNHEVPFVPFLAAGFLLAFFTQWNPFLLLG